MADRYDPIPLDEWIDSHRNEDDLRFVFLNLDLALKYIHDHGYCVDVFYPSMIEVLDNKPDHIRFKKLIELSKDSSIRMEMIKEDIFRSSLVQIGIYSNSLKYLKPEFLKENFDSFVQFIPSGDVPYYRGVIQRGSSVYYSEYISEKNKRDLIQLEEQINEGGESNSKQMIKSNGHFAGTKPISNDAINDTIYRQINGLNDSAFIYALILPSISILLFFIIGLVAWLFSIFS